MRFVIPAVVAAALSLLSCSTQKSVVVSQKQSGSFPRQIINQARAQQPGFASWLDEVVPSLHDTAAVRMTVTRWVASGLDEQQLRAFMQDATNKQLVFQRLQDASKGVYQQRVVIDDYKHIPGVKKSKYVANGLSSRLIFAKEFGVDSAGFDLPENKASTFRKPPRLVEIKPGEKLYRVTNDSVNDPYAKTGAFWTRQPPTALSEVIGGVAVMPEWNNFQRVYVFTAPPYANPERPWPRYYVWEGPAAAQAVSGIYLEKAGNGYCLPGGKMQVFIPSRVTRSPEFVRHIRDVTSSYKKW